LGWDHDHAQKTPKKEISSPKSSLLKKIAKDQTNDDGGKDRNNCIKKGICYPSNKITTIQYCCIIINNPMLWPPEEHIIRHHCRSRERSGNHHNEGKRKK
jgi:hypothetical protein